MVKIEFKRPFTITDEQVQKVSELHNKLHRDNICDDDYLGWRDGLSVDQAQVDKINECAKHVQQKCDVLVVCGVGGSYLGAKCAYEALKPINKDPEVELVFLGKDFSIIEIEHTLFKLKDRNIMVNVISKSGTTLETMLSFRYLMAFLKDKYPQNYHERVIVTTDAKQGILRKLVEKYNYQSFIVPNDIGGRFSVFTAVGLLPLACAGIDIVELLNGMQKAVKELNESDLRKNIAYQYAVYRHQNYDNGHPVELFVNYEPSMSFYTEWLKQLYGESEGKNGLGVFPASCQFSTDLHSLGQFVQDGSPVLFQTVLTIEQTPSTLTFPIDPLDEDGLNYLSKSIENLNQKVCQAVCQAHLSAKKMNICEISIPTLTAHNFGYLTYFFMIGCAMSAYLFDVNPFDQPGVEVYKKEIKQVL